MKKNIQNYFFSETVRRMKLKIGILALDIALYKSYDFYSGLIRTMVAMATYCFHRLFDWLSGQDKKLILEKKSVSQEP